MEQNQFSCRLCLIPINSFFETELEIFELIKYYIKLEILDTDNFSKLICDICSIKLKDFHSFVLFVKSNNEKLLQRQNKEVITQNVITNKSTDVSNVNIPEQLIKCELQEDLNENDDEHDSEFSDTDSENVEEIKSICNTNLLKNKTDNCAVQKNKKIFLKRGNYPETANDIRIKKFYKYECDLCKNHPEISTFRSFKIHYKTAHGIPAYIKCCGNKFTRPYALVEHIDGHLLPDSLICTICNKQLRTKQTLQLHMDNHMPHDKRQFKCKYCDMRFVRKHYLQQHEKVHLSDDEMKYVCDLCGKRFATKWRLKTHLNNTHSDAKPFVCEICAKSFKLKVQLKHHKYTHNSKEQFYKQCDHCGIWLRSPKSFYSHVRDKHDVSAPKNFPCDKCTHISPTRKALYAHSKNKHGPKKHNCQYCNEAFSSSNLLKSHMVKHTGPGEPLKCPLCPKIFSFRSGYYSHKKRAHPNVDIKLSDSK